jgi:outer membrane lipoprotein carrier protein
MSDRIFPLVLALLLTGGLFPWSLCAASAAPAELQQEVIKIQDKYHDLVSLGFDFSQNTRSGGRMRHGEGHAVFYRPGNDQPGVMRWDYTEPDVQIILNDGRRLSIYTQKDHQLIITSADELQSDITYSFFAGTRNLLDDFTVRPASDRFVYHRDGVATRSLQLIPKKPHNQIKAIHLWFDKKYRILRLLIEDHFDSITELDFSNIRLNELPPDSKESLNNLLWMDLPQNTEIIRQ